MRNQSGRLSRRAERLAWTRFVEGGPDDAPGNKYNAVKTIVNDEVYDSSLEAKRAVELQWLLKLGEITELQRQVNFPLIPKQDGERAVVYKADFVYRDKNNNLVVEDAKGCRTQAYILKRKLMLWVHNIRVREIAPKRSLPRTPRSAARPRR
jgi:hypothetical protein